VTLLISCDITLKDCIHYLNSIKILLKEKGLSITFFFFLGKKGLSITLSLSLPVYFHLACSLPITRLLTIVFSLFSRDLTSVGRDNA